MAHRQDCPRWEAASGGHVPHGAVEIGKIGSTGESMFVGRARIDGDLVPGKVAPSHRLCYVGCNNREKGESNYEVLVNCGRCALVWKPAANGQVPSGAIEAGMAGNREPLYIARGCPPPDPQGLHGGKVHPSHGCAYIPCSGTEHRMTNYEVLCQEFIWA